MGNPTGKLLSQDEGLCFQGINFTGALLALAALHSGIKVNINIEKPLNHDLEYELITVFPTQFSQLSTTISNIRFLEKIASIYPSLITNQRVLTLFEGRKIKSRKLLVIDFLLKRGRDEASLPIRFTNYPQFKMFEGNFVNGALVPEFRFDRNMALLYLLEICRQQGAEFNQCDKKSGRVLLTCNESNRNKREIRIEENGISITNNLRFVNRFFETTLHKNGNHFVIHFRFKKPISEDVFLEKTMFLLKSVGVASPDNFRIELISIYKTCIDEMLKPDSNLLIINDYCIENLNFALKKLARKISTSLGKSINIESWFAALSSVRLNGDHFRNLHAACDEKFDLAKQTGIEYNQFCYYFFRYSNSIDDFIERAYEQANISRSEPDLIWRTIEAEFLETAQKYFFE